MCNKKSIYLSHFINEKTPLYGGLQNQILIDNLSSINSGDTANSMLIKFPNHTGTHIDFPLHFSNNGKTINDYPPDFWFFKKIGFISCNVNDINQELKDLPYDIDFLIIKTDFEKNRGSERYWKNQPIINSELAKELRLKFKKLRAIGFDMISLTSKRNRNEGKKAHIEFLINENILIVEDMSLRELKKTPNKLFVFPTLIDKADGSPCTIIATF